jgi:hypothetical protein
VKERLGKYVAAFDVKTQVKRHAEPHAIPHIKHFASKCLIFSEVSKKGATLQAFDVIEKGEG